jgi:hypothetical protein
MRRILICVFLTAVFACTSYAQEKPEQPRECTEYLPLNVPCQVTISIPDTRDNRNPAPSHADVTIKPRAAARVVLTHASPLMNCTIAASPAPLTRDVTSSVATFFATIGTLGAPAAGFVAGLLEVRKVPPPSESGEAGDAAREIDSTLIDLESVGAKYNKALHDYEEAKRTIQENWRYTYSSDSSFAEAAARMFIALQRFENDKLPSADDMDKSIGVVRNALASFHEKYSKAGSLNPPECGNDPRCIKDFQDWFNSARQRLSNVKPAYEAVRSPMEFFIDAQSKFKPAYIWLNSKSNPQGSGVFTPDPVHPWTTAFLPMTPYAQKQVTETVTCKDVASQTQVFDNITFTAYYERSPSWDLSAGAVISLLPGHEVGPVSGPVSGTPPASSTILGITSQSAVQFVPAAIFEFHPSSLHMNVKCPWAQDGTGDHPWGYVCSWGPAVGFLVNPNNGTTAAEFFEGISFGIHRLAFLVGNHTGRFQEFGEGYEVGQTVPSGTMPPTFRRWTNHPTFGITYRIPIR